MAKIVETENKVFPKDPMDKKLLFASIKRFKPEGVRLGGEKVSKLYKTSFGKVQMTVQVRWLEKVKTLQYDLDEEGQYIEVEDEFGDKKKKFSVVSEEDSEMALTTLFMNVNVPDGVDLDENTEFTVYPTSGTYPLFKAALQEWGELPEDMGDKAFSSNPKEIKEALEGFEFVGKVSKSNGKFKFEYLDVVK